MVGGPGWGGIGLVIVADRSFVLDGVWGDGSGSEGV